MNKEQGKSVLRTLINYLLEGGQSRGADIKYGELFQYGVNDPVLIREALVEWEKKGLLILLKDPRVCKNDEYCVKMLSFIDQKSPIKGWLNWE